MLTWSFGWAPSPARLAITSLAFMFEEVPEPVWKTSIGNWSSCLPSATAVPAAAIRSARSPSSLPSAPLASAAADLIRPSQRTTGTGTRSPETGKLSTALVVSPPQSCSLGVVSASTLKFCLRARESEVCLRDDQAYCAGAPGGLPSGDAGAGRARLSRGRGRRRSPFRRRRGSAARAAGPRGRSGRRR